MGKDNHPDGSSKWRLPVNPELSRKQHWEDVSAAWIIAMHQMDCVKSIQKLFEQNPMRAWELALNTFAVKEGTQAPSLQIVLAPLPQATGPVPGVLTSPIPSQIAPPLKLVVNAVPVETIEAGDD